MNDVAAEVYDKKDLSGSKIIDKVHALVAVQLEENIQPLIIVKLIL